jgi:hypothetical protein
MWYQDLWKQRVDDHFYDDQETIFWGIHFLVVIGRCIFSEGNMSSEKNGKL